MILTYTRTVGPEQYSSYTDETFADEEDFEYEIDWDQEKRALAKIIFKQYFSANFTKEQQKEITNGLEAFIDDLSQDSIDDLENRFEDDLHDFFEEDAFDSIS